MPPSHNLARNTQHGAIPRNAPTHPNFGPPEQKTPALSRRPYSSPGNIGRRFSQTHPSFPKPMSSVSTIRGNLNSHFETEENLHHDSEQTYPIDEVCDSMDYFLEQPEDNDDENNHWDFSIVPVITSQDLNSIYNAPQLPSIFLFGLKILIDSGACNSMMNPGIA